MTSIITPALVRRYLIATGWTVGERGFLVKRASQVGLFEAMTPFDLDREIQSIATLERSSRSEVAARLGMLAAAEMNLELVRVDGIRDVGSAIELRAFAMMRAAGVDPEAWEKARGA